MNKWIYAIFGIALLGGLVFAIAGASVSWNAEYRWNGVTAGSDVTEGGNITDLDVSANTLTDKWAAYYGNVDGNLTLDDDGAGDAVYTWTWSDTTGTGEVCLSQDSAFDFASVTGATATELDNVWFGGAVGDSDSATNTFTGSNCVLNFTNGSVGDASIADHSPYGQSTYYTCAVHDGNNASESDYGFCVHINTSPGSNYNGTAAAYEVMVPTTEAVGGSGEETYYFYLELDG